MYVTLKSTANCQDALLKQIWYKQLLLLLTTQYLIKHKSFLSFHLQDTSRFSYHSKLVAHERIESVT